MKKRIVRLEENFWRIRTEDGELAEFERQELEDYLLEIRMPYQTADECIFISGAVKRDRVFEVVELFYKGRADVYPF